MSKTTYVTTDEFVARLAQKSGMTQKDSKHFMDTYLDTIVDFLEEGKNVRHMGLMTYEIQDKPEKEYSLTNKDGEKKTGVKPAHRKVKAKVGSKIKEIQ